MNSIIRNYVFIMKAHFGFLAHDSVNEDYYYYLNFGLIGLD